MEHRPIRQMFLLPYTLYVILHMTYVTFSELLSGRYITKMIRREDNDASCISFSVKAFELLSYKNCIKLWNMTLSRFYCIFIYPDSNFPKTDRPQCNLQNKQNVKGKRHLFYHNLISLRCKLIIYN